MGKKKKNCKKYYIIYETTNLNNDKIYRGKHWTYTPYEFDGYLGSGNAIKAAIKKYGRKNFSRKTLFVTEDETLAYLKEAELVDLEFVKRKDTYNMCGGGRGAGSGENNHRFGVSRSKESKKKQSDAMKGRILTDEHKKNISDATSGENCSPETRKKRSDAGKGRTHSKETRKRQSDAGKGRIFTEEHKKNISDAKVGTYPTEETRKKISDAVSGEKNGMWNKHHTEEAKEKQRNAKLGTKHTEEAKNQMSESTKGEKHPLWGKHHTEESRIKNAIAHLSEEVFYRRLKDIEEIDKVWGFKAKLARKWGVCSQSAERFIKHWENIKMKGEK